MDRSKAVEELVARALAVGPMTGFEISSWATRSAASDLQDFERLLYPTLHRLQAEGLLSVETAGDPPRRTYSLADEGSPARVSKAKRTLVLRRQNG